MKMHSCLIHFYKRILVTIPGELENSSLGVWPAGTDVHVQGILHGGNGSGGQQKLLVGLLQVDDVATIVLLLVDVLFHGLLAVAGPDVGGSSQHLGNIILLKMCSLKYL